MLYALLKQPIISNTNIYYSRFTDPDKHIDFGSFSIFLSIPFFV
jgi:hypothetical protein